MPPTRRSLLRSTALLSLGLAAGCLGDGGSGGNTNSTDNNTDSTDTTANGTDETMTDKDDTTDTETGTDETETDGPDGTKPAHSPELSLANVDKAADVPIEHSIEVTEAATTDEHPPQVRVTLTNTSDEAVQAGEGRDIFFKYITDDSDELIFLPAGSEYSADPGCWRLKESLFLTQEYQTISLDPGESRSELVDLYGAAKQKGEEETCLPVGEFRFESNFSVSGSETDEKQREATCSFSISLD